MHKIRVSLCFYGRVQGVGFRYKLRYLAEKYSVTGWVRNESDGSVAMEVQGSRGQMDQLIQKLQTHGRYIRIDHVSEMELPVKEESGFRVK